MTVVAVQLSPDCICVASWFKTVARPWSLPFMEPRCVQAIGTPMLYCGFQTTGPRAAPAIAVCTAWWLCLACEWPSFGAREGGEGGGRGSYEDRKSPCRNIVNQGIDSRPVGPGLSISTRSPLGSSHPFTRPYFAFPCPVMQPSVVVRLVTTSPGSAKWQVSSSASDTMNYMVEKPDAAILFGGRIVLFSDGTASVVSPAIVLFHSGVPFGADVGIATEPGVPEFPMCVVWWWGGCWW